MPTPSLLADPTRQMLLRTQAVREIRKRFTALAREITVLVVADDAFGLTVQNSPFAVNAASRRWAFMADADRLEAFQTWLANRVNSGVFQTDPGIPVGQPWLSKNIYHAYNSGAVMAYRDAKKAISAEETFLLDREAQFLSMFQSTPKATEALRLLYVRQYTQLRGVTDAQSARLGHILASGFADGKNAKTLAKEIAKALDISRYRAETIALTEISNAHSNGALDAYAALGVDNVVVLVEWKCAAGACKLCTALQGVVLTIKEARGLIPRHPRCRCGFQSSLATDAAGVGQVRSKARIRKAFVTSLKAETGKRTIREATKSSKWRGALLKNPKTKRQIKPPRGPLGFPTATADLLRSVNSESE